jgi:methylated-DNA-protein-cysteine methyltransferase related protein
MNSPFKEKVIEVIRFIPPGKVVSYGQVAAYIGAPRAARQVGWILRGIENSVDFPWWRVVNNAGRISISGNFNADKRLQKKLLEAEGVIVLENFTLDIDQHRYVADDKTLRKLKLPEEYIRMLHEKYFVA